jgi:LacI family transcriptional regulator
MPKLPHIALLIETSTAYGRGLLAGVARYVHEHGPWSIYFRPQGPDAPPPPWLSTWRGDGIIARLSSRRMANAVLRTGSPTVDVRNILPGLGLPGVGPDNRAVVQLALSHFLDLRLRHVGFLGARRGENRYLDVRRDCFRELAEKAGLPSYFHCPERKACGNWTWEQEQGRLAQWLKLLPKPVGVMACDDDRGLQVLDACLRTGLVVPDEVAIVGVNNDEALCRLTNPPLSSIDVNPERIGCEAAALLDRLMAGAKPPTQVAEFAPRGLVIRQSSDTIGVADPHVAAALRYIRAHASQPIAVSEVAGAAEISQSTLERRFTEVLRRTPNQEIRRVRLAHAQRLLTETDLPLATIAQKSGFRSIGYFCEVFHQQLGCTPGVFRRDRGIALTSRYPR